MEESREDMTLGEKLHDLRKRAPLTQKELAQRARVGIATIKNIEQGRADPRPSTIRALAAALGVEPSVLTSTD